VRGNKGIPRHNESHKLLGSMKARQECMRPRAGKDGVCISYNAMMSMYSEVIEIYTPGGSVHPSYPCMSVCMYIKRLG